jgi:hypothetical protein
MNTAIVPQALSPTIYLTPVGPDRCALLAWSRHRDHGKSVWYSGGKLENHLPHIFTG